MYNVGCYVSTVQEYLLAVVRTVNACVFETSLPLLLKPKTKNAFFFPPSSRHAPSFTEVSQAVGILGDTDVQGNPSLSLEIQYIYHWQHGFNFQKFIRRITSTSQSNRLLYIIVR